MMVIIITTTAAPTTPPMMAAMLLPPSALTDEGVASTDAVSVYRHSNPCRVTEPSDVNLMYM